MKVFRNYTLSALACIAMLAACNSDDAGDSGPKTEYDRQAMIVNYADNLIIPGYQAFKTKSDELTAAVAAFTASPSVATLVQARTAYRQANLAWQDVSVYEWGPADEQMLRNNLNIFPTAANEIESNISAGTYDLQAAANLDAKGFPALDYLLYGKPTDAEVVALYTSGAGAANRKKYLQDVTDQIKQRAETVYAGWTSGNYSNTFKESPGTAVGSAVGNLVNQLNFDIDLTKRAKLGIPYGRFTAGAPLPEKAEAPYSNLSLELLKRTIKAEKATFIGQTTTGTNGPGLDDYLDHVGAKYNDGLLSEAIEAQFNAALAAAEAIPAPLYQAVTANNPAVKKAYDEMQKLIVLTKTDMPAALGVTITYTDNDGD